MKRQTNLKLKQLRTIVCAWLMIGMTMTIYDHFVLHTAGSLGPSAEYSFSIALISNIGSALIGGLFGGGLLVFFVNVRFQDKPYAYTIISVTGFFMLVILLIITVLAIVVVPFQTGKPISDPETIKAIHHFLKDSSRAKNIMTWALVVAATQLLLQINSKFGPGVFRHIASGRYNIPRKEKRIFMFLDINSSTSIAEQLGDEKYHCFLKDFFADITIPVLENNGEIYQYVGDEVVISWKYKDGIFDSQCAKCFFEIKRSIQMAEVKYLSRYGLIPSFKAGLHGGEVVAGEIGIIKRDITYSGDVLNTTSRIVNACKDFNAEIIISAELISDLSPDEYDFQPLGYIHLKGKENKTMLYALSDNEEMILNGKNRNSKQVEEAAKEISMQVAV